MKTVRSTRRPHGSSLFRKTGWLAAAAMLAVGAFAPTAALATTGTNLHQTPPIAWDDKGFQGSDEDCAGLDLQPGEVFWHFILNQTDASTGTLTATFQTAGVQVTDSYKNSGSVLHFAITTGHDTLLGAWTDAVGGQLNLSHICVGPDEQPTPTPTETPTDTPTATPTDEATPTPTATPTDEATPTPTATPTDEATPTPTATPTDEATPTPTATPTDEATPTPTATPTDEATPTPTGSELAESGQPSGEVEGATGTPGITPPPTDAIGAAGKTPSNDGWRIVLIGIAAILAATLAFTTPRPASVKNRRR